MPSLSHRSPAGRAPTQTPILFAATVFASLPKPAAAFWYSRNCVQDPTGTYHCTGLSWSAGAGIGLSLLLLILALIFLAAWLNRPAHIIGDVEEVWVAPAGVFAVTPLPGQGAQVHMVQVQQQPGGVNPWMPSTYRSPYSHPHPQSQAQGQLQQTQQQAEGAPLAPGPPPSPRDPYPSTIPEQTPRSGVMRDVPLNSAGARGEPWSRPGEGEAERLYPGGPGRGAMGMAGVGAGPGPGPQDVWRQPGTPGLRISVDRRDDRRALR